MGERMTPYNFLKALGVLTSACFFSSVNAKTCLVIGDSQMASSQTAGLNASLREGLEARGVEVFTYSISSTSAEHWHSPARNPLRFEVASGPLRVSPETGIIPNLDSNSPRSLFQQILDHHTRRLGRAPECVLFQLGDNAPRTGHVRPLIAQLPEGTSCFWAPPTWSEEDHPDNRYRFKTQERTVIQRNEIEQEIAAAGDSCQILSTTGRGDEADHTFQQQLASQGRYTTDGLHLNARGGALWARSLVSGLERSLDLQVQPTPAPAVVADQPAPAPLAPAEPEPEPVAAPAPIDEPVRPAVAGSELRFPPEGPPTEQTDDPPAAPAVAGSELRFPPEGPPTSPDTPPEVEPAAVPVPTPAPRDPQYQVFELVCRSRLNMRAGPSTRHNVLDQIPCSENGVRTPVAVLGEDPETGWMRVLYDGQVAWVSNNFLRPTDERSSLPRTVDAEAVPGELNCRSHLNFRAGPSTSHVVRGQFNCSVRGQPTAVQVLGRDPESGWYLVEGSGDRGFVHPRYLNTHGQVAREIANLNEVLSCENPDGLCVTTNGEPPSADCPPEQVVHHESEWLPHCEVLATQPNRPEDFDRLNQCYNSIRDTLLSGLNSRNPNRADVFRRMYRRLNSREQHFIAMTLTAIGEAGVITPPLQEMSIVMKVIENRTRNIQERGREEVTELDIVLQHLQFSMYNSGSPLWASGLRRSPNDRQRRNALQAYIQYQNADFEPSNIDRVYHYHANYVSPNWKNNSRIVRPVIDGQGLRQRGTRHIFYRDIAWGFRHNPWSGKR